MQDDEEFERQVLAELDALPLDSPRRKGLARLLNDYITTDLRQMLVQEERRAVSLRIGRVVKEMLRANDADRAVALIRQIDPEIARGFQGSLEDAAMVGGMPIDDITAHITEWLAADV